MSTAGDGELALRARSYYAARAARSLPITPLALRARLPYAARAARSRLAALALRARIKNSCSTQEISKNGREREPERDRESRGGLKTCGLLGLSYVPELIEVALGP